MRQARLAEISLLAILLACSAPTGAAAPAVTEAQGLINQGKFEQALQRLDGYLKAAPQDAEARFTRGLVLVRLNRNDDAIKVFSGLTRDYPQLPEPYNNLAVIHAQQGDYEKARDALEAALATHPSYGVAHENLGDIYAALAAAAYNRALTLDQNNPSVRAKLNLINELDSLGDAGRSPLAQAPAAGAKTPPAAAAPAPTPGAVVAPAGTPTAPVAPAAPALDTAALEKTVQDWAAAWSSRDAERYLSFYAPAFKPEGGLSRDAWAAQRRDRVTKPKSIKVGVSDLKLAARRDGVVQATFQQEYQSDTLTNRNTKILDLASVQGAWRIVRESSR